MTMISCHITWYLPLQLGVTYVGSGSGGGDVISGGGSSEKMCLSWYVGFLLTHFCCAFLSVVLSEEQKQSVNMFVDPVNKFFQVWCVCVRACVRTCVRACVRAYVRACVHVFMHACLCMPTSFYFSVYIGSQ